MIMIYYIDSGIVTSLLEVFICVCYLYNKKLRQTLGAFNLFQSLPQTLIYLHRASAPFSMI
jgi:hypothetical protein